MLFVSHRNICSCLGKKKKKTETQYLHLPVLDLDKRLEFWFNKSSNHKCPYRGVLINS